VKRGTIIALIILLLAGGAAAGWYFWDKNKDSDKTNGNNGKSQIELPVFIEEASFSIRLPEGWYKDSKGGPFPSQFIYRDSSGNNMFQVVKDEGEGTPLKSGESVQTSDYIWHVKVVNSSLQIVDKSPHCSLLSQQDKVNGLPTVEYKGTVFSCEKNQNETHVNVFNAGRDLEAKLKGHFYYFSFVSFNNSLDHGAFLDNVIPSFAAR